MLLFFIASAFGGECNSKRAYHLNSEYNIYVCNTNLKSSTLKAVEYWRNIVPERINIHTSINCSYEKNLGSIYVLNGEEEVKKKETDDFLPYAVTVSTRDFFTKGFLSSEVHVGATAYDKDLDLIVAHEIGHGLGFDHVSKSCYGHIMNTTLGESGYDFY